MDRRHLQSSASTVYLLSAAGRGSWTEIAGGQERLISDHSLYYVQSGRGTLRIGGVIQPIEARQLYYAPPQSIMELTLLGGPAAYCCLSFKTVTLALTLGNPEAEAALAVAPVFAAGRLPIQSRSAIGQGIESLCDSVVTGPDIAADFALRVRLEQLLDRIMQDLDIDRGSPEQGIERSIAYMNEHLSDKLDLETLAGAANMNCDTYARQFKKKMSRSPLDYLNGLRMEQAKKLLNRDDCRVKEVAAEVGFNSEFYFSRMFRRTAGISPSVYMRRKQLKIAFATSMDFHNIYESYGGQTAITVDLYKYPWMTAAEYEQLLNRELACLKAAQPDLIIADDYCCEHYEELRRIAPTVILDEPDWSWRGNCLRVAELTGREREAGRVLDDLERHTFEASRLLDKQLRGERVTVMQVSHKAIGIQGTSSHPLNELLYQELGLKAGGETPKDTWRQEMAPEDLPDLQTHHLFIQKHHLRAGSESVFRRMTGTSSWRKMDLAKSNRCRLISNWFLDSWTPVGRHLILKRLLEYSDPAGWRNRERNGAS
ncbi:helix-turn-helix domain-containing protein [Cohnella boryungensis]|uniref:Helix-turn-helix domain-containing protein n=1 Tax=Cohnella boryungensis TaxID=768479 RepID=A0ABV8SEL7_9BACL